MGSNGLNDLETDLLIRSVYQATWADFYVWEQDYCREALHSLARHLQVPQDHPAEAPKKTSHSDTPNNILSDVQPQEIQEALIDKTETFTVLDYDLENGESKASTLAVESFHISPCFAPCPPYEICTPVSRNINVGDDSEYMPFIPLIDDPTFNYAAHVADYRYFEWQRPNRDPDLEIIVLQTVFRLHTEHKLSLSTIDQSGILPLPVLGNPEGIIYKSWKRDFPPWEPIVAQSPAIPYPTSYAGAGPNMALSNLIGDFCNNFNCVIGYCTVHMGEMPMPEVVPPTIPSGSLAYTIDSPCSTRCFLLLNPPSFGTFWTPADIELIRSILRYSPDTSPCDLAVICRKPCQEVFKYRRLLIPDAEITNHAERSSKVRSNRNNVPQFQDHDAATFTPNWPCGHPGPCDSKSKCPCFLNNAHCENGCRCDRKCARRWRGCNCAGNKHGKTCGTSRCPCYKAHRECDPSVCLKCNVKQLLDAETGTCKNAELQRNERKLTVVRMSQWGLGLFLEEPAEEEDLLIEYTGELIYELTTLCRDFVSTHRGRTYLFQLNPTLSIDSSKAGNESRFINHSKQPNCHACVRLVNGEHRIGLFALKKIDAGVEIFLDYGDSFFERGGGDDKNADKAKWKEESLPPMAYVLDQHSSDETYTE